MYESILVDSLCYKYVGGHRDWVGRTGLVVSVSITKEFLNG